MHKSAEPSVYARAQIFESACARSITILITLTGSIQKTLGKRRRLNRKKLAALHQVVFQVEFSLLLAFLGPLESSAVEKVHGMSLQYPTTQEAPYLCNGAVSEKSPQIFRPPLPAEYVTVFSG